MSKANKDGSREPLWTDAQRHYARQLCRSANVYICPRQGWLSREVTLLALPTAARSHKMCFPAEVMVCKGKSPALLSSQWGRNSDTRFAPPVEVPTL